MKLGVFLIVWGSILGIWMIIIPLIIAISVGHINSYEATYTATIYAFIGGLPLYFGIRRVKRLKRIRRVKNVDRG